MTSRTRVRAPVVVVIAALAVGAAPAGAPSPGLRGESSASRRQVRAAQDHTSGPYLYRTFCASCHGPGGRGDGPVSDVLSRRPPNLTTIAARRGGKFPRDEVYAVIDGRRRMPAHGDGEMPIWGDVLRATEGHDEAIIKRRIDALVIHVESLQAR